MKHVTKVARTLHASCSSTTNVEWQHESIVMLQEEHKSKMTCRWSRSGIANFPGLARLSLFLTSSPAVRRRRTSHRTWSVLCLEECGPLRKELRIPGRRCISPDCCRVCVGPPERQDFRCGVGSWLLKPRTIQCNCRDCIAFRIWQRPAAVCSSAKPNLLVWSHFHSFVVILSLSFQAGLGVSFTLGSFQPLRPRSRGPCM